MLITLETPLLKSFFLRDAKLQRRAIQHSRTLEDLELNGHFERPAVAGPAIYHVQSTGIKVVLQLRLPEPWGKLGLPGEGGRAWRPRWRWAAGGRSWTGCWPGSAGCSCAPSRAGRPGAT